MEERGRGRGDIRYMDASIFYLHLPASLPPSLIPDVIDIMKDQLSGSDYKQEEDPRYYVSEKTGRGPLAEDWVQRPPNGVIMCAYKLIKVN